MKETSTPTGYLPETEAQKVEVTANTTNELKFPTNIHNTAYVKLQKQYRNYKEGYVNVDSSNYKTFQNAFTLQKKVGDGDWEAATNINGQPIIITLLEDGTSGEIAVPVYQIVGDQKTEIQYQFVETLPEDWQGENGETESVSATVPSLEGKEGTGTDAVTTVTMKNQRTGEITLTKL